MVELRCNNCKRVFQYSGDEEKFYTICPQCNAQVPIAGPRNYGTNNPEIFKGKRKPSFK
jgi:Zn finger protein HypA/HybF involved in hydrogenase expression